MKVRKKLRDHSGESKMRTVWKYSCKIGTTNLKLGYFFDKPEVGMTTYVSKEMGVDTTNYKAIRVHVDNITEDEIVFCTPM